MDVKEAVKLAKQYVFELFAEEGIENLGLEEVKYDEVPNTWSVTIGFSRPWDQSRSSSSLAAITGQTLYPRRSYKVILISNGDAKVISVTDRVSVKDREVES